MAVLGLRFCARAFSTCSKRGPLFIAVRGPLTIAASLVAEHRLQTRRLSNHGSWAQPLRGMWDLPRPGLEPMSHALAGRFSTTAPPGKPPTAYVLIRVFAVVVYVFCFICFLLLSYLSSLYILDINPLSDIWFANIFSYLVGCLFILLWLPLLCRSFLVWYSPTCL